VSGPLAWESMRIGRRQVLVVSVALCVGCTWLFPLDGYGPPDGGLDAGRSDAAPADGAADAKGPQDVGPHEGEADEDAPLCGSLGCKCPGCCDLRFTMSEMSEYYSLLWRDCACAKDLCVTYCGDATAREPDVAAYCKASPPHSGQLPCTNCLNGVAHDGGACNAAIFDDCITRECTSYKACVMSCPTGCDY
jgi:hypothetical protein